MQVDEIAVAVGDHHPVRRLGACQAVTADQHQRLAAVCQQAWQVQRAIGQCLHTGGLQRITELLVNQANHLFLVVTAYATEKQRA